LITSLARNSIGCGIVSPPFDNGKVGNEGNPRNPFSLLTRSAGGQKDGSGRDAADEQPPTGRHVITRFARTSID
jgi:hypothetical protein